MALVLINTRWGVSGSAGLWRLSSEANAVAKSSMLLLLIRRSTALSVQALLL